MLGGGEVFALSYVREILRAFVVSGVKLDQWCNVGTDGCGDWSHCR